LFLALCVQIALAWPRARLLAAGLVVLLALTSVWRQLDYRSEIALWESDVRKAPWNARAHNNLGYAYQRAGMVDAARREYEAAELLAPGATKARFNLLLLAK
jgi:Flp pilus assembly protein TadD